MESPALQLATDYFVPLGRLMSAAVADADDEDLRRAAAIVRRLADAVTEARGPAT